MKVIRVVLRRFAFVVLAWVVPLSMGSQINPAEQSAEQREQPRDLDIREQTGRRLVQLDVTVSGPGQAIAALTRDDFELVVGGELIEDFFVDGTCPESSVVEPSVTEPDRPEIAAPVEATALLTTRATFLFYFDQTFLTMAGRVQAQEQARELISKLITGGNRGMVVSSGQKLATFADLTDSPDELLEAVDRLAKDPGQWDPTMVSEESRIDDVLRVLQNSGVSLAESVAKRYYREEIWLAEKSLSRVSMVLGRLADLDAPKALIYFADRIRSSAGEHYLELLPRGGPSRFSAVHAFDRVIDEANSHGVRLYAIQAEGMTAPSTVVRRGSAGHSPRAYIRQAQDSLVKLALETGGQAFLNGIRGSKMARLIREDLACVYLISFDPGGLPEDQGLPVRLRTFRDKVKTQVRGQIVVQSESSRTTSRLMAAFGAPDTVVQSDIAVHGIVIPTGFDEGKFSALVQVVAGGSPLSATTWDLGLSLVSRGEVREDASARLSVSGAGTSVVLETEMSFPPGPYELVVVAHETTADQIATSQLEGKWEKPDAGLVTVGPIAVMQPARAAFLREGEIRLSGALGRDDQEPLQTHLPTAAISLICRGRKQKGTLRVERHLVGDSSAEFPVTDLEAEEERCAQIRDVIPSGVMTAGAFDYELRVFDGDTELAMGTRTFFAVDEESDRSP